MAADFAKRFCYLLILEIATVCKSDVSIETFHFDYSVIEATGKTCPGRDNCKAEVHKNGNGYHSNPVRNHFLFDKAPRLKSSHIAGKKTANSLGPSV